MNILVYGAGAIGSLYGALLSKNNGVTVIGRKPHVEAINKHGLKISGVINENYKINAATTITEIPNNTILLVCVKTYDLENSLNAIKNKLKDDTTIVLLQNGLGNEEVAQKILPSAKIVRGISAVPVTFLNPGEVIYCAKSKTYFPKTEEGEYLASLFNQVGIETEAPTNFNNILWLKLIVNCVVLPLTALHGVKNKEVLNMKPVAKKIIEECAKVALVEGIIIQNIEKKVYEIIKTVGENTSSMLQDIMNGKRTEIDFINGKIVELGNKHGINVPYNEILVEKVKLLEEHY